VQESVEHGGGDGGVAEDLAPGSDAPVGGQDDAGFGVALGDDLEQGGRGLGGQGEVAQFVDLCGHPHSSTYADTATMPRQRLLTWGSASRASA
jgi:hypothetical protein